MKLEKATYKEIVTHLNQFSKKAIIQDLAHQIQSVQCMLSEEPSDSETLADMKLYKNMLQSIQAYSEDELDKA